MEIQKLVGNSILRTKKCKIVKIEQVVGQAGHKESSVITIQQLPARYNYIHGSNTHYQWGRKDAFPGFLDIKPGQGGFENENDVPEGTFVRKGGNKMSIENGIQHPNTYYTDGDSWKLTIPKGGYFCYNLWSMNNTETGFNDNTVVKTIYDPCPVGFKMPASNAFTGFSKVGENVENYESINGERNLHSGGTWLFGWAFYNKINNPDATIFFPISGYRWSMDGDYNNGYPSGFFNTAIPYSNDPLNQRCYFGFDKDKAFVKMDKNPNAYGYAVRPVADE